MILVGKFLKVVTEARIQLLCPRDHESHVLYCIILAQLLCFMVYFTFILLIYSNYMTLMVSLKEN